MSQRPSTPRRSAALWQGQRTGDVSARSVLAATPLSPRSSCQRPRAEHGAAVADCHMSRKRVTLTA
jgi:hypothetical protein